MNSKSHKPPQLEVPTMRMSAEAVSEMLRRGQAVTDDVRERAISLAAQGKMLHRAGPSTYPRVLGVAITTGLQSDLLHPFFSEVFEGVKERAVASRYDLLLFSGHVSAEFNPEFSYVARCRRHGIAGVILMGFSRSDPELAYLVSEQIPAVAIDLDLVGARATYVMSDNVEAAATVVQYLNALGYTRIAHISGIVDSRPGIDRILGYRSGLERAELPFREEYMVEGDFYEPSGYAGMERLLTLEQRPEAVFCSSDMMALGAIRAAHAAGLRVPEDIAVVGFDDASFASMMEPALTTVRQDKAGLGAAACEALMRIIDESSVVPPVVILSADLMVRESCGAALRAGKSG
ncbi:MAG TPA: substrate-binding domain-containing protein [Gaiellaceae bacterium]